MKKFGEDIWIAGGASLEVGGFSYNTRMAVIRLSDGGLFIWSPIQLTEKVKAEVDALGSVSHIVSPIKYHHLFIADWQAAYPDAKTHAAPGLTKRRKDLRFDAELQDGPDLAWADVMDQAIFFGNPMLEEVIFYHRPSRTVLFCDLLQQFPAEHFTGWRRTIARLDLMIGPEPTVPRKFRVAFINRRAARTALERILNWQADRLIIAHGDVIEQAATDTLRRAFTWLKR